MKPFKIRRIALWSISGRKAGEDHASRNARFAGSFCWLNVVFSSDSGFTAFKRKRNFWCTADLQGEIPISCISG
jgi:hypothetical protein